jgi:multisubunit Na+/H+ antiporter MnhC subunit
LEVEKPIDKVPSRLGVGAFVLFIVSTVLAVAAMPALAHGELAGGEDHDDPTTAELLLTPIVVGIIHIVAMVALLALAYRARATGSVPDPSRGPVPEEADQVFSQFLKEEDVLDHAFRPNRRMFMVSKNLPHFFVLTALATFFSIYTYKWLGDNTVLIYTTIHATAILVLFAHSAMALSELDSIEVLKSRWRGLLDVSSLKLVFKKRKQGAKVDLKMRAIDSPDKIKEVILDEASRSKTVTK